ncbi:DUF3025 domain-containing protein [Acidovorax sp. FJL06]|uniref:DUF3025 domain-containing protein n=1 Tax=Acidovorax sp. FJL06 TaxID=2153365 RepID=UPI000F57566A|nr:DUF3025 domain-containing protein [Acidovorax sp. FJL06]RQO83192.1 DUF3025 domain-containing protein [Acidovorax sp. FJL06]
MAAGVSEAFGRIDWNAPWLQPWRGQGEPVAQRVQGAQAVHQALQAAAPPDVPVGFVPHDALPDGMAYEQYIGGTRRVPTRDNLHDFFNGLVWLHFPHTKRRLNELQAGAIATDGVQAVRGPLRDALTVFDENGALLQAPDALWDALRARDWQQLFLDLRPLWGQARLVLFGHALLEKLVSPRKPMVAHVYPAPSAIESIAALDAWLAQDMSPSAWAAKPFTPLPVLGVPGWWAANEAPGFYADAQVFRPPRGVG